MKRTLIKLLFAVAFVFFAAMAILSGYKVYTILAEYREGEKASEELQQFISLDATAPVEESTKPTAGESEPDTEETEPAQDTTEPESEQEQEEVAYPVVDFEALLQRNESVAGWIYIEGTNINYPIVQGTDNQYYTMHLLDGRFNSAGSIFLDYRNQPDFSDDHTIIYGHNMKNKTMFAQIAEYKNPAFYEAHPMGKIMTPNGNFQIEMIAGYVADLRDEAWHLDFETDEEFLHWLQDTLDRSAFDSGYVPEVSDRIITLSTCSYEFDDARFVLVCRVVE